jgi:uncharacterized protein YndB with AHSA1/START domain
MAHVEVERFFPHPVERVFRRYTDHPGWSEWAGFGRVYLTREGSPEANGVGAVRAFASAPGLREEIVRYEAPSLLEYRVVQPTIPLRDHHGAVQFAPEGSGTRVTWRVTFRSAIPGLGWALERSLTLLFGRMLASLARDLDAHAA